ncbi:aminotransferase class I/II-fold pyridoxal phosphate-dependent enzyme [Maribacter algarum]|uniref:Aminotransferase class I/II-fold pyridoxal phosphate-dependent enzyme n=1 Tax=Maribacter algarum (ex Zhang et al. 2020) TaxID=2578118 RepID=A0A5S3PSA9_9FLAO|nr:aminotransferase class I/II-fold pyridoxal phosphate-dependent enzyme [Maribacter algarum]TMM56783.1 aminotransferase class I/II-fold pyridoxal phosphate-dependent enzyme [Maribacter algarum]
MTYSIDAFPGRTISVNGKSYLYFGGTSYLGLQTDAAFQEIYLENLKNYGTNYAASRKANVQISVFEEVEAYLAGLVGSESCITMSSGYLAGQLVAQSLNSDTHELFYAPESHSAVHIPGKETYQNFGDLGTAITAHFKSSKSTPVVFTDSILVLEGAYPDFLGLRKLPLEEIILVIDDSHGIGIVGKNGNGAYERVKQLNAKEVIVCCSLGKAYGIQAGGIFGTKSRIEHFKNTDFFGGASPAPPAAMATLFKGEKIFEEKRKLLNQNIQWFVKSLKNLKLLNYLDNYPAFYFSNPKIASFLEKNNVLITNFNYPNEDSPLMSRIVLSAAHTKEDIAVLAELLNSL